MITELSELERYCLRLPLDVVGLPAVSSDDEEGIEARGCYLISCGWRPDEPASARQLVTIMCERFQILEDIIL